MVEEPRVRMLLFPDYTPYSREGLFNGRIPPLLIGLAASGHANATDLIQAGSSVEIRLGSGVGQRNCMTPQPVKASNHLQKLSFVRGKGGHSCGTKECGAKTSSTIPAWCYAAILQFTLNSFQARHTDGSRPRCS